MKCLVQVLGPEKQPLFECYVVADNEADAMERVKRHLTDSGRSELLENAILSSDDIGGTVDPSMPFI